MPDPVGRETTCAACGNDLAGDNLCMVSACQWEGTGGRKASRSTDLSLTALAIYQRLRPGNWHPSEYEAPEMIERWYARISQAAAEAVTEAPND